MKSQVIGKCWYCFLPVRDDEQRVNVEQASGRFVLAHEECHRAFWLYNRVRLEHELRERVN